MTPSAPRAGPESSGTVIVLSRDGVLARAARHAAEPVFVAAIDEAAAAQARAAEIPHALVATLPQPSKEALLAEVDAAARRWYRPGGHDPTLYDGVSLGELFYVEAGYDFLFPVAQRVALAASLWESRRPTRWVLATAQDADWAQAIRLAAHDADVRSTGRSWLSGVGRRWSRQGVLTWIRDQGLDRAARETVFALMRLTRRRTRPQARPVLFVVDIPVPSVMETLLPVIRAFAPEERLLVATDPRCLRLLETEGLEASAFTTWGLGATPQHPSREDRSRLRKAPAALEGAGGPLQVCGVDLWPAVGARLLRLLRRRLAIAAHHRRLAEATLRTWGTEVVVTASDSHYSGQLFVACARRLGAHSVNIQHGLFAQLGFGYLPARATRTAVMGDAVKDLYLVAGVDPDAVVVTGLPRLDALCGPPLVPRREVRDRLGLSPDGTVCLFAPDPVSYGPLGDWMWSVLTEFLRGRVSVEVMVRPHPADALAPHVGAAAGLSAGHRSRVTRWPDSGSALRACDVLVCALSTLALEALIVDRPVILLLPDASAARRLHYVREECAAVATNAAELREAWDDAMDSVRSAALAERRRRFVQRYARGADGRGAERVRNLIRELRPGAGGISPP